MPGMVCLGVTTWPPAFSTRLLNSSREGTLIVLTGGQSFSACTPPLSWWWMDAGTSRRAAGIPDTGPAHRRPTFDDRAVCGVFLDAHGSSDDKWPATVVVPFYHSFQTVPRRRVYG